MTTPRFAPDKFRCCIHCEHDYPWAGHTRPCEDRRCLGSRPTRQWLWWRLTGLFVRRQPR